MSSPEQAPAPDRSVRAEQTRRTRERILEALAGEIVSVGAELWSLPAVARRAGVAVRTVYRHFPTRPALLSAFDEWARDRVKPVSTSSDPDDLGEACRADYATFEKQAEMLEALLRARPELGAVDARRIEAVAAALSAIGGPLKHGKVRQAIAVIAHLSSPSAWQSLRDGAGLGIDGSAKAAAWAIRTLVKDLQRRAGKSGHPRSDRKGRRS